VKGLFVVLTETSRYVVNFDERWVRRCAGDGVGPDPQEKTPPLLAQLRRDGDTIELLGMDLMEVGLPMVMYLNLRRDGVVTMRRTTNVMKITQIA
jgi:hypothetical protein